VGGAEERGGYRWAGAYLKHCRGPTTSNVTWVYQMQLNTQSNRSYFETWFNTDKQTDLGPNRHGQSNKQIDRFRAKQRDIKERTDEDYNRQAECETNGLLNGCLTD